MESQSYKERQQNIKRRMCTVYNGHDILDDKGRYYRNYREGIRLVGYKHGDDLVTGREPKNKKERRKAEKGLAYLDKKGVLKAD